MARKAGLLLLDKETGVTSFAALGAVKQCAGPKAGHAGTLDRFASGLLVVLTGPLTRLNPLFSGMEKTYEATFLFGSETDTLDPEGKIVKTSPVPSREAVEAAIRNHFTGCIEQVPPAYSALHVQGRRASEIARQGGDVVLKPRSVTISSFDLLSWKDTGEARVRVTVSSGTYVRALARDLGRAAGSCAHVTALRRLSIGPYRVEEAVPSSDREGILSALGKTRDLLLRNPSVCLSRIPEDDRKMMENGRLSSRLRFVSGPDGAPFSAIEDGEGTIRWVADLRAGKIVAQIREGL